MQTYLQSLANKLNSGEKFNINTSFETELTLICTPPSGSGRGKERSVGRRNVEGVQAKELHRLAGVPEGPCGLQELEMFQKALINHT